MIASAERRVRFDDGHATTVDEWGESGPVIVCVHGISSSRKSWERFAQHFGASYRIFGYDQRGHGDSAKITGPMTLERCVRDLETVVASIGVPIHAIVGHSWGGAVVLLGGRRTVATRVVAIDPLIRVAPGTFTDDYVAGLRGMLAAPTQQRIAMIRDTYADLPPVEIDAKVHALKHMTIDPIVYLGDENRVDDGKWDLRDTVAGYPKPLLLLLADPAESVVSADDLSGVRARGGSNLEIEIFEGQGHALQRTAFDRFAARVERFLG